MDFSNNFDIPIFTEEFLDHNKNRDTELRQLRKSNTDYEQQNAILQKHIENMKNAIDKLETDICQQKKNNVSLQEHLDRLRRTLVDGFSPVKLPGVKEMATYATIDSYMTTLHSMLLENSTQDASLLQTIRDIVGRMEFNGWHKKEATGKRRRKPKKITWRWLEPSIFNQIFVVIFSQFRQLMLPVC